MKQDPTKIRFRDLKVGQEFDWINELKWDTYFYDRCVKISNRSYKSLKTGMVFKVGSINARVYNVKQ